MVIDKTNPNLISPLLGNRNKETFYQLKSEYEKLIQISRELNNNINKKKNKEDSIDIDYIKNNINKIKINLEAINENINEYFNFYEDNKISNYQETKDIINKIILEQKNLISIIKENKINIDCNELVENFYKTLNYESEIKTISTKSDNSETDITTASNNIIEVNEENNNATIHNSRNKIFIPKFFNNARVIRQNNFEYSIEEPCLLNDYPKLFFLCFIVLWIIFIISRLV